MKTLYPASKLYHATFLRNVADMSLQFIWNARWLRHEALATAETEDNARGFWRENRDDIRASDGVVLFCNTADTLSGALIEVGMALACQRPVYIVGQNHAITSWQFIPSVRRFPTFAELETYLASLTPDY